MATERVTVVIDSRGGREVRRAFDAIGDSAGKAARSIRVLQNAFFVLGAAGLIRGLTRQLDTLTEFENRLRLTTKTAAQAEAVQQQLFDVARRSRSEFESVAEVYTRAALSLSKLGVSTDEVLRLTESLSKAAIVSGASARESNAALVQLSQGLASNRLSGDELRSVLEQLPYVAEVLAEQLGVTRGELREMGRDGELTTKKVFDALQGASAQIDEAFARTAITISQAFAVARTNWLQFLDSLDDGTGMSAILARAIVNISNHIGELVTVVGYLAVAIGAAFVGKGLRAIYMWIDGIRAGIAASRAAIATDLARKKSIAGVLAARQASTAANVQNLRTEGAMLLNKRALLVAEVEAARFVQTGNQARMVQTGTFANLTAATARFEAAQAALLRTDLALVNAERALNVERGRAAAVTNAATAATGRYTAAQVASTAGLARFGAAGRLAQLALSGIGRLLAGIVAFMGGPWIAIPAAIAAVVAAFVQWGNLIKFDTVYGLLGLRDIAQGALQAIGDSVNSLTSQLTGWLDPILQGARQVFSELGSITSEWGISFNGIIGTTVQAAIDTFNLLPNMFLGIMFAIIGGLSAFPDAFAAIIQLAVDKALAIIYGFANTAIAVINGIVGAFGSLGGTWLGDKLGVPTEGFEAFNYLDRKVPETSDALANLGTSMAEGFAKGSNLINESLAQFGDTALQNAADIAGGRNRPKARPGTDTTTTTTGGSGGGGGGGGGGDSKTFSGMLDLLRKQIEVEKEYGLQKLKNQEILRFEKQLKRDLTDVEKQLLGTTVEAVEMAKIQGQILESINGPAEKLKLTQQALNDLLAQGAITLGQYNDKLNETYIAAQRAAGTLSGGFKAAIAGSIQSASEFGEAIGGAVTNAVDGLSNAFVEFAKTGKFSVREVFQELFAQLLKLALNKLFMSLLGGVLGMPGGGLGGALGGGGQLGILGLATGGSIMPSGPGSTDSQLVAFKKRPDERVDVLTPRQQENQRKNMQGGQNVTVQSNPKVAVVMSEEDVRSAFAGEAGDVMIVRAIERRKDDARAVLGG